MSEKRYFKIEYDEEWYLFDSTTISEQLVKEQAEYGYGVFANSLSPSEVVDVLNEQQSTITELKSIINFVSDEGDLIVLLMKEIIKLRQEVQECRAYETIEKGVSNYD